MRLFPRLSETTMESNIGYHLIMKLSLLTLTSAVVVAIPQNDALEEEQILLYAESPEDDPIYEPQTASYDPIPQYPKPTTTKYIYPPTPNYPEETEYKKELPETPSSYFEHYLYESDDQEELSENLPPYYGVTLAYAPPTPYTEYTEESNYPEKYPKNPPPYPKPVTKYPAETPKYPPLSQKPVYPEKYIGKIYPTPKYFKTTPAFKHLRSTYSKMTKAKFSWTSWSEWADCSASCNTGIKKRTRDCLIRADNGMTVPKPERNYECEGNSVQIEQCSKDPCPINGGWSKWGVWSLCSASCGDGGLQTRVRDCNKPVPANGGKLCQGAYEEFILCRNPKPCPVDGGWGVWLAWSSCSKSCGYGGITIRSRSCSDPTASYGGQECMGLSSEVKNCFETNCTVWSVWTDWSTCTVICGIKPFHQRNRVCLSENNITNTEYCEGEPIEFKYCDKPRHIFEPAKYYELNVPGCGVIHGACVNSWFVTFNRESPDFDMNKNWMEYKTGFGKPPHNFYLGNEYVHCATKSGNYTGVLEIITKSGRKLDYKIPKCLIASEADNYASYSVSNMSILNIPFSTYDRDNDRNVNNNCARIHGGGWWYDSCYENTNLFGDYTKHFEMKINTPDNCLKKARGLMQRNPTIDDVNIHPFNPPKYPNKSHKEKTKAEVY